MANPHSDRAEIMKARLDKIRADPERALFSDYKGLSPSGAVTVRVDLLGRLQRFDRAELLGGPRPEDRPRRDAPDDDGYYESSFMERG
jgi:hypothetical protein